MELPIDDGFIAVVKRDCPTCGLVAPVLGAIAEHHSVIVYSQDDPTFPEQITPIDDRDLDVSFALDIDTVPTLIRIEAGAETRRLEGWFRPHWQAVTGIETLGDDLPELRPGCGSRTNDPEVVDARTVAAIAGHLASRTIEFGAHEDDHEAMFERGWTDGLPVVAPTPARVARMLAGTTRDPNDVVVLAPPDLVECSVEKIAINAVMAGCKPEYLPVVIAAVEAACTDAFNAHGILCTTWFSGPMIVVNGPMSRSIGMNSGVNVFGQGNRANATIGRALQLVIRNVGGGRPGEIDRAAFGWPGKYTFCFAEREHDSPWDPLHVTRGFAPDQNTVTLFAAGGLHPVVDQLSRDASQLANSFARCLRTVGHPKNVFIWDAFLAVGPEHARVFREAGWSKDRLRDELAARLQIDGREVIRGADDIAEGMPEGFAEHTLPKFRDGGLQIVHCGGEAGLFSAIIAGWASGAVGSEIVTKEIRP